MVARLYLTVYARDDMLGSSLGTVDAATELEYTDSLNGSGYGRVKINRHHSQAALLQQDRYCRVHSDAGVVGAFFLIEGVVSLSDAEGEGGEWITWSGPGPMALFGEAIMDNDSDIVGGHDPIEGFWDLSNQGPLAGASSAHPITMLKRAVVEAMLQTPTALGGVDHSSFDYDSDSNAVALPFIDGAWGVNVGDDLLTVVSKLSQVGGAIIRMSTDFELSAYQTYGTDRTASIRFAKGLNIAAAISRKVRGGVLRTHLLVGGADRVYVPVVDPDYTTGDVIRWGFLSVPESSDLGALEEAGLAHIAARKQQSDVWKFPLKGHGDDAAEGIYEPLTDYNVGDLVTVHTGTGTYDTNEQALPIASITWRLLTSAEADGDYRVLVEVGSTFDWTANQGFDAPGTQHGPGCPFFVDDPTNPLVPKIMRAKDYGAGSGLPFYDTIAASRGGEDWDSSITLRGGDGAVSEERSEIIAFSYNNDLSAFAELLVGGHFGEIVQTASHLWQAQVSGSGNTAKFYFIGGWGIVLPSWTADPAGAASQTGQVYYNDTTNTIRWYNGTIWADLGGGGQFTEAGSDLQMPAGFSAIESTDGTSYVYIDTGYIEIGVQGEGFLYFDPSTGWTASNGTGDTTRVHDFIDGAGIVLPRLAADPAGGDSQLGQVYYNTVSDVIRWYDGTTWADMGGGAGGAPTDATYLVASAHAGLSAEIVVGATPGGELGGSWASPTVDATHSGSTHDAATNTHIADATDAHDASAISFVPNGSIAATDVQAAIQEVRDEAGSGVTDHGALTGLADDDHPQYATAAAVGARVKRASGDTSLPTINVGVVVAFDAEDDDTDGFHDNATNNSRLTVPSGKAGVYDIKVQGYGTTSFDLELRLNGTTKIAMVRSGPGAAAIASYHGGTHYRLAVGDYVEVIGMPRQASRTLFYDAGISPIFSMYRIGT